MAIAAVAALSLVLDAFLYSTGKRARSSSTAPGCIHKAGGCVREYACKCRCVYRVATCVGSAVRGGVLRVPDVYIFMGEKIFYHNNTHAEIQRAGRPFSLFSFSPERYRCKWARERPCTNDKEGSVSFFSPSLLSFSLFSRRRETIP